MVLVVLSSARYAVLTPVRLDLLLAQGLMPHAFKNTHLLPFSSALHLLLIVLARCQGLINQALVLLHLSKTLTLLSLLFITSSPQSTCIARLQLS